MCPETRTAIAIRAVGPNGEKDEQGFKLFEVTQKRRGFKLHEAKLEQNP